VAVGLYARFVDGEDCPARSTYLRDRRNRSRKAGSDAIPATFRRSAKCPRGRSCSRSADHRARRFRPRDSRTRLAISLRYASCSTWPRAQGNHLCKRRIQLSSASRGTHGISCERDRAPCRRHLSVGCKLILQPASVILADLTGFELLPDPEEGRHHVGSEFLQSFRTASPIRRDSAADGFHQGRSVSVKATQPTPNLLYVIAPLFLLILAISGWALAIGSPMFSAAVSAAYLTQ
jgi:hypothetical protein